MSGDNNNDTVGIYFTLYTFFKQKQKNLYPLFVLLTYIYYATKQEQEQKCTKPNIMFKNKRDCRRKST